MPDEDINKPGDPKTKQYPFWPDSLNAKAEIDNKQVGSTGIFKLTTLKNALVAVGKLAIQGLIFWMLFIIFFLFLFPELWGNDQLFLAVAEIIKLMLYTASVFLAVKILEEIEISDLGLKINGRALHDFGMGLLISFTFLAFQFLLYWGTDSIEIMGSVLENMAPLAVFLNLIATFAIFSFTGWSEELLSRGYQLRVLTKGFNRYIGAVLSSVIFAYDHRGNLGATWEYLILVFLVGTMMCFAVFRTGQLWLAIGLHTGWDFFSGVVFGLSPINGLRIFHLIEIRYTSLTVGEDFAITFIGLISMTIFIYFYWLHQKPEPLDW